MNVRHITRNSIENIYKTAKERMNVFGLMCGYSTESREFFLDGNFTCKEKYDASNKATYEEFKESGFYGTGYISCPREIERIRLRMTTKERVIEGINKRRWCIFQFPNLEDKEKVRRLTLKELKSRDVKNYIIEVNADKVPKKYHNLFI